MIMHIKITSKIVLSWPHATIKKLPDKQNMWFLIFQKLIIGKTAHVLSYKPDIKVV